MMPLDPKLPRRPAQTEIEFERSMRITIGLASLTFSIDEDGDIVLVLAADGELHHAKLDYEIFKRGIEELVT
jgi:hypothetical protein